MEPVLGWPWWFWTVFLLAASFMNVMAGIAYSHDGGPPDPSIKETRLTVKVKVVDDEGSKE